MEKIEVAFIDDKGRVCERRPVSDRREANEYAKRHKLNYYIVHDANDSRYLQKGKKIGYE